MQTSEFSVGSATYRATKMDVFMQYDVARKWAPILIWVASSKDKTFKPADFARAFCAVSSPIPKEDSDYVLGLCLDTVKRGGAGSADFAPIRVSNKLMFDDIELPQMLEIVYHVLKLNKLIDFFVEAPATSEAAEAATK